MPLLTAWANDNGYANVFSEELLRVARTGDILVCLSCSGTSPNILAVLHQAWKLQMPRVLLTGQSYLEVTPVDIVIQVQSGEYGVIEDVHSAIGHWLTKEIGP
jgi:D-sedoheptulose 7-phosphate isomerase